MVTRMDRLIVSEIAGPFVFGVLLFTSLFFAGGEIMRAAEFLGKGVPLATVLKLLILTLPFFLAMTLPMAMLLAALLGFNRLSNDSEIIALVAAGTNFTRIVLPVAVFALGVSLVGLWFGDSVVPAANRGRHAIITRAESGSDALRTASAFDFSLRDDGALTTQVHVEDGMDLTTGMSGTVTLRQVSIETWQKGRMVGAVFAERAEWVPGSRNWRLEETSGASWNGETMVVLRSNSLEALENARIVGANLIRLGTPDELKSLSGKIEDATIADLRQRAAIHTRGGALDKAREAEVEIARRIVMPFASLVFAMVGAPLGVRPQRAGKGVGFGLAILIIFSYWISLNIAAFFGKSGYLPPLVAMWLPNVAGIAAAAYLIRRVLR